MDPTLQIRAADDGDLPALADLYEASVQALGPERYTPEQVASWAAFAREDGFRPFVLDAHTLVAVRDGVVAGFAGLTGEGRVASLYVHPDHGRRGVGGTLLAALLDEAGRRGLSRLSAEASDFSRPVFERAGFRLDEVERVERRGAVFTRYRMVRESFPLL